MAHIHKGKRGVAGDVLIPLCGPCKSGQTGQMKISKDAADLLESRARLRQRAHGEEPRRRDSRPGEADRRRWSRIGRLDRVADHDTDRDGSDARPVPATAARLLTPQLQPREADRSRPTGAAPAGPRRRRAARGSASLSLRCAGASPIRRSAIARRVSAISNSAFCSRARRRLSSKCCVASSRRRA